VHTSLGEGNSCTGVFINDRQLWVIFLNFTREYKSLNPPFKVVEKKLGVGPPNSTSFLGVEF